MWEEVYPLLLRIKRTGGTKMKERLISVLLGIMLLAGSIGAAAHVCLDGDPPPICTPRFCPPVN